MGMVRTDKRRQIMQAAEKMFAGKRLHEITLDDIAREVRIGKGTIYTYFKDKDDLFFQVATQGFDEMCGLVAQRVTEDAPFRQQLREACEAITAFFSRRRQLFRMIQTEDARMALCHGVMQERWFKKRKGLVKALGKIWQKGQDDGLVRTDLSAEVLAGLLLGMLRARARIGQEEGKPVGDELLVDLFLRGAGRLKVKALKDKPAGRSQGRPRT
jgi:AcrR family transcriptional regulator